MNKLDHLCPRVAVVEDDAELQGLLAEELSARGCEVVGLGSAEELYRHMSVHTLDIVVLDLGLPGESGLAASTHLRQLSSIGIIILTGRRDRAAIAKAAADSADLFLTKPVDFDLLGTAVLGLHRRLMVPRPQGRSRVWALSDGGWTLQGPSGATLPLSSAERMVLSRLFEHPGTPVSRAVLIEALSDEPWDFDPHRLDVLMHRLRGKVANTFSSALPLRAVRGVGYVLTP